jgi:Glycosyl hydrolases family 18
MASLGLTDGRHAPARSRIQQHPVQRRIATLAIGVLVVGLVAAGSAAAFQPSASPEHHAKTPHLVTGPIAPDSPQTHGLTEAFAPPTGKSFHLAAATKKPLAAPPSLSSEPSLQSHEVFGFAPYWTLASESGFDVSDLTTLSYFGVDVNANGTIQHSGDGWTGYESQDLANLISRAHSAGDRVVLTAECFNQATLNAVTSSPTAATTLGNELVGLVQAKSLDGVNIDFEGQGSADQAGLDKLIATVSSILRKADSHWQLTMDTYASSAGDPNGFYDIQGLAPNVDAFFVMAYQMGGPAQPANSKLGNTDFSAQEALQEYTQAVPASKVILGLPYYGYEWPTSGPGANATATGPATPVPDSQILSSKSPVYWNQATATAWTESKSGSHWHQTWFEDPAALAIKAQLAGSFGVRGVGIWSLGMDGNDPAMLSALVGNSPVIKDFATPPTTSAAPTSTTTTRAPTTTTTKPPSTTTTTRAPTTTTSTTATTAPPSTTTTTEPPTTTTDPPTTTTTAPSSTTSDPTTDPSTTTTTNP